jgi:hypothetical protein
VTLSKLRKRGEVGHLEDTPVRRALSTRFGKG